MKRGPFAPKRCEDGEDWLLTYSDMVTLLLTFFIILVSISKIDAVRFEEVTAGLKKGIGEAAQTPLEAMTETLNKVVTNLQLDKVATVGRDADGIVIDFNSSVFFEPGSATLKPDGIPVIERLAATLLDATYLSFQVEVQGHTDDVPINTPMFPSNWELSAARATGVVRLLIQYGVTPVRLRALGFADVAPKVPNRTETGEPIPAYQEINRRISVRVYRR